LASENAASSQWRKSISSAALAACENNKAKHISVVDKAFMPFPREASVQANRPVSGPIYFAVSSGVCDRQGFPYVSKMRARFVRPVADVGNLLVVDAHRAQVYIFIGTLGRTSLKTNVE